MSGDINMLNIGVNIKELRKSNHLTQDDLAQMLGYSLRSIQRLEREGTDSISLIINVAKVFNVNLESILFI